MVRCGLFALVLLGLSTVLHADTKAPPDPVLHEYVAPPKDGAQGARWFGPLRPSSGAPDPHRGSPPAAIRYGSQLLPKPIPSLSQLGNEPTLGRDGIIGDRATDFEADKDTEADGTLQYVEPFNPSVVPFKRQNAFDAVRPDGERLHVADHSLSELPVGGAPEAGRDLFWASLRIELSPAVNVAIPSVAPDMRILSYEIEPALRVVFSKDSADNFYVRTHDAKAQGIYRLVFLCDAPASYFGGELPRGLRLADAQASGLVRPLPAPVKQSALALLGRLRISSDLALDVALSRLVAHFRAFEAGASPAATGNLLADLTRSQRGVCRHRSFAFMVLANALGIATRYVTNEAHAFVEVWLPEKGWRRIDLGGAALTLRVTNAQTKAMHQANDPDPFAQPRTYAENYSRLRGTVSGLDADQRATSGTDASATAPPGPRSTAPARAEHGAGLPRASVPGNTRRSSAIEIIHVDREGFRGESVKLLGRAFDAGTGQGIEAARVDVYLVPAGMSGEHAVWVGQTATDAEGRFATALDLGHDLPLGDQEVYVATPGTNTHAPSVSE
jgi:hypothetical protein